jgi:acetyltransferase
MGSLLKFAQDICTSAISMLPPQLWTMGHGIQLEDARNVAIRSILPTDRDALKTFFESLTRATRRLRFHLPVEELPESLLHAFTAVDQRNHVALVAEAGATAGRPAAFVAEARYVRGAGSDSAEFALVVADGWRRVGLGTSLMRNLVRRARLAGLRRLCGDALRDNEQILTFMRSLGARTIAEAQGAETLRLCLDL